MDQTSVGNSNSIIAAAFGSLLVISLALWIAYIVRRLRLLQSRWGVLHWIKNSHFQWSKAQTSQHLEWCPITCLFLFVCLPPPPPPLSLSLSYLTTFLNIKSSIINMYGRRREYEQWSHSQLQQEGAKLLLIQPANSMLTKASALAITTPTDPNIITWSSYTNDIHGFRLSYPHSWVRVEECSGEDEKVCCLFSASASEPPKRLVRLSIYTHTVTWKLIMFFVLFLFLFDVLCSSTPSSLSLSLSYMYVICFQ